MPITANKMSALREVPGIFRSNAGYYWFLDPQDGWQGPFESATEAIIARMKRDMPPDTLANTKSFREIERELENTFGLEESHAPKQSRSFPY